MLAAVLVVAALARYVLRPTDAPDVVVDPGLVHVHGLGVNPANGRLYAASHTGLFRVDRDGSATRIGDRYQDTMGFTVVGPDRFLASGHPDLRDRSLQEPGKPPLLGLIESTDGGRTWQARSLLGDADLHTIAVVGDLIVGYDSTGERVVASNDGRTWETRSEVALVDLAVDPADAARMVAVGTDGAVRASLDGGRSWTTDAAAPVGLRVLRWGGAGLWGGTDEGAVHRFDPATATWTSPRRFEGAVEALLVDGDAVYAAVDGFGIYRSRDAGRAWERLYRPGA